MRKHASIDLDQVGKFLFFAYTNNIVGNGIEFLADDQEIIKREISFTGNLKLILFTNHAGFAENSESILILTGFCRERNSSAVLNAGDLLNQGYVSPNKVSFEKLSGNYTLYCFSKTTSDWIGFRMVLSTTAFYHYSNSESFVAADKQVLLLPFVKDFEISEENILSHLLFRKVFGENTYFKEIRVFNHGQLGKGKGIGFEAKLVQTLDDFSPIYSEWSETLLDEFDLANQTMVKSYVDSILQKDENFALAYSGGVDSSVLQYWINKAGKPGQVFNTISYVMQSPDFEFETEYAKEGSQAFGTSHQFANVSPEEYPQLLIEVIQLLGQPVNSESTPCKLALAKYARDSMPGTTYLMSGYAADSSSGAGSSKRLLQLDRMKNIPFAAHLLRFGAGIVAPVFPNKTHGARDLARILEFIDDERSFNFFLNERGSYTDFEMVRKWFTKEQMGDLFESKILLEKRYHSSDKYIDRNHYTQLAIGVSYEMPKIDEVNALCGLPSYHPYLDYEYLRAIIAFDPSIRYYNQGRAKPILKRILEKNTAYGEVEKEKGHSGFANDLVKWMKSGPLQTMVQEMDRPGFISGSDFRKIKDQPNWLTWNLLTFDIFNKYVINYWK